MKYEIEELKKLINDGLTIKELSEKLNTSTGTIKRLMFKNQLKSLSIEKKKEKNKIYNKCKECGITFTHKKKTERKFCSKKCCLNSNKNIIEKNRLIVNDKISNKLRKNEKYGICLWCKNKFEKRRKSHNCCSKSCSSSEISNRPEYKKVTSERFSNLAQLRYKNGDLGIGWKSRNKLVPSYPEKLTIDYLNKKEIEYEYELKCGKYFIDFAFINKKIALEIDGRQHNDLSIIKKDNQKDIFLKNNGWIVFRLKWKNDKIHYNRLDSFIVQFGLE